jgi:hypothetical protein
MLKVLDCEPPALTEVFLRWREEQHRINGRLANQKGKLAEKRVFLAVEKLSTEYTWIHSARLATLKEDARGIDVVVETPIGPLYIQVKSSPRGVRHYKSKRRKARVIMVIVKPEMDDRKLRDKVSGALHVQRNHILEIRRRSARARKQKVRS